jgi:hypothetical protein
MHHNCFGLFFVNNRNNFEIPKPIPPLPSVDKCHAMDEYSTLKLFATEMNLCSFNETKLWRIDYYRLTISLVYTMMSGAPNPLSLPIQ